jgi:L-fucose mutarotase
MVLSRSQYVGAGGPGSDHEEGGAVLTAIDPILTGTLLAHLDAMGHSDAVVLADAHFPADRLARRLLTFPGLSTPAVLAAVRSVIPLDDPPAVDLMTSADGSRLPVQEELAAAAGATERDVRFLERRDFYDVAAGAYLIVRTGETRTYGNVIVRKGVVIAEAERA